MKILLKNISNTYNYGSMMMAENLICYLKNKIKDLQFFIEANDSSDIERLKEATKYDSIFKDEVLSIDLYTKNIKYVRVLEKKIRRKKHVENASRFYNAIIVLGGDDFSEIYYSFPKDNVEIKFVFDELKTFNTNSKLYMIGQTIGPYTGDRIELATETFKNIKIYTRDNETAKYMKDVFNIDVSVSRDLALLDLNLQKTYENKYKKILTEYSLIENKYITIVGTGLINKYVSNENVMVDAFYLLIKKLKKKYPDYKIVCLSHVFTPDGINDNILYDKINKKYKNYISKNCVLIDEKMLPVKARIILGHGIFTITCRMHAAVSTFQMGKPAICIAYSKKYKGVIGEGLGMNDLIIDAKQKDTWSKFSEIVFQKIHLIEENTSLRKKIADNVNECKSIVEKTLDSIIADLRG